MNSQAMNRSHCDSIMTFKIFTLLYIALIIFLRYQKVVTLLIQIKIPVHHALPRRDYNTTQNMTTSVADIAAPHMQFGDWFMARLLVWLFYIFSMKDACSRT